MAIQNFKCVPERAAVIQVVLSTLSCGHAPRMPSTTGTVKTYPGINNQGMGNISRSVYVGSWLHTTMADARVS